MRALADNGTCLPRDLWRAVRTVVSDDVDVVKLLRIIEAFQILDELTDDRFFVMCGNDNGECLLRHENLRLFAPPQATKANKEKIQSKEKNKNLRRHHDDVKNMCRKIWRDKM